MKLKVVDRLLAVFIALLVLVVAVYFILGAVNIVPLAWIRDTVALIESYWVNKIILGAVGLALMILSICLITAVTANRTDTARYLMLKSTETGGIYASIETVRQIIASVLDRNNEITRSRVHIRADKTGLHIHVVVGLKPETIIPDFSAALQETIRQAVQTTVGVDVGEVKITVDSTAAGVVA